MPFHADRQQNVEPLRLYFELAASIWENIFSRLVFAGVHSLAVSETLFLRLAGLPSLTKSAEIVL